MKTKKKHVNVNMTSNISKTNWPSIVYLNEMSFFKSRLTSSYAFVCVIFFILWCVFVTQSFFRLLNCASIMFYNVMPSLGGCWTIVICSHSIKVVLKLAHWRNTHKCKQEYNSNEP